MGELDADRVGALPMLAQLGRCWLSPSQPVLLVITNIELNVFPTIQKSQANRPLFFLKGKDASIIISRSRLEFFDSFTFQFGGLAVGSHSGTNPHSLIRTQLKLRTKFLINPVLNGYLIRYCRLNRFVGKVTSICKPFQESLDVQRLFRGWSELANDC